jgi:UDP:flavonoid glycosyltransferase YjiC (YdhE family)
MRVLFTCQPALGHFHPLVPLARALQRAGHEPVFATSASFGPHVEAGGFQALPAGLDWLESEFERAFPDLDVDVTRLGESDRVWRGVFARAAEVLIPDLISLLRSHGADVVVSESLDYAGPLAAEATGVRHAVLGVGACLPLPVLVGRVGAYWSLGRKALGLADDPGLERLCPYLYLDTFPPSMQPLPVEDLRPAVWPVRPADSDDACPPPWLEGLPGPRVYVTMGTIFNRIRGAFEAVLDVLRDEPVSAVVTVGPNRDPAELGPQPSHVRVERYVPEAAVLPYVDLVVCHGGSNTTVAALAAGLPMLVLPLGADQFYNAFRMATCGVGLRLDPRKAASAQIRDAVRMLLGDRLYRENALRLAREIAAMPPPEAAVDPLERLAAGARPRLAPRSAVPGAIGATLEHERAVRKRF